jgi:hypothetical protein
MFTITLRDETDGRHIFSVMMDAIPPVGAVFVNEEGPVAEVWEVTEIAILAKPFYLHSLRDIPIEKTDAAFVNVKRHPDVPGRGRPQAP